MRPHDFKRGQRCPKCRKNIKNKDTEYFKKEVFEISDNFEVLGDYIGCHKKIKMSSKECGHVFEITPSHFLSRKRCPVCNKREIDFYKEFSKFEHEYELLEPYKNIDTKILTRHKTCNSTFMLMPNHFLHRGDRCTFCRQSKNEKSIESFLTENNIPFSKQVTFEDLFYKNRSYPLKFDFMIDEKLILEYDGEYHFINILEKQDPLSFSETKIRDNLKDIFCDKNKIPLIRIPYWSKNQIKSILIEIVEYLNNKEEIDYENFKYFKFELYEKFNLNEEVDNDL